MSDIRRPRAPLLDGLKWLLPAVAFLAVWGGFAAARPAAEDLAALLGDARPVTRATAAVEAGWVDETFAARYLPSPPGPLPCVDGLRTVPAGQRAEVGRRLAGAEEAPGEAAAALEELEHPESWLPPLAAGNLYLRAGDVAAAERVLDRYLGSPAGTRLVERVGEGVRGGAVPPTEEVLAALHLLQSSAYVQIERESVSEGRLWRDLKNPIGYVRLLGRQRALPGRSAVAADSPWRRVPIPSPGCGATDESLTSQDLYNNLIVGYLRVPGFRETEERRSRELYRDYDASPATHPSLAVLREVTREWRPEREGWVWALSNAERVLRDLPWERPESLAQDPWVALNLAQLLEEALAEAPPAARETLEDQIAALVRVAARRRAEVGAAQRDELHPALARMLLLAAVRENDPGAPPPALPEEVAADLSPDQRETAAAVQSAVAVRRDPARWVALAAGDEEAAAGEEGEELAAAVGPAWRRAAREDLAATVAARGRGLDEEGRREWARRARGVLAFGDEAPLELVEIEEGLGFFWKVPFFLRSLATHPVTAILLAAGAAVLFFLFGRWLGEELRRRRALFTSFYRLEAEEMRR